MSDTKMLQAILDKVKSVDGKVDEVKEEVRETRNSLTARIDKLGLQLAELSDDAPTIEEFDNLEKRVTKIENHAAKN